MIRIIATIGLLVATVLFLYWISIIGSPIVPRPEVIAQSTKISDNAARLQCFQAWLD